MPTTINDLPPECLRIILLQLEDDSWSLAQLLRVNRQFLQLAVPILYSDPFDHCSFSSRPKLSETLLLSVGDFNMICGCPSCAHLYQGRVIDTERIMTMAAIMQATNEQTRTMAPYIDFMTVFACYIWTIQFYNIPEDRSSLSLCTKSSSSCYLGIHNAVLQRCAPRIKSMLLAPFALSPDMLLLASQMTSLRRLK